MKEIEFKTIENVISDDITESVVIACVDVTKEVSKLFDNVSKAYLYLHSYSEYSGDTLEEWKEEVSNVAVPDISETFLEIDSNLYIKFKSGKVLTLYTNEYASLYNKVSNGIF